VLRLDGAFVPIPKKPTTEETETRAAPYTIADAISQIALPVASQSTIIWNAR
jgi:hypothetical protein